MASAGIWAYSARRGSLRRLSGYRRIPRRLCPESSLIKETASAEWTREPLAELRWPAAHAVAQKWRPAADSPRCLPALSRRSHWFGRYIVSIQAYRKGHHLGVFDTCEVACGTRWPARNCFTASMPTKRSAPNREDPMQRPTEKRLRSARARPDMAQSARKADRLARRLRLRRSDRALMESETEIYPFRGRRSAVQRMENHTYGLRRKAADPGSAR